MSERGTIVAADQITFNSEHRLRAENLNWDIDVWYPLVKDYTFKTVFIPLKLQEAKSIIAFNNVSWRHVQSSLTSEEEAALLGLQHDIEITLKEHFCEDVEAGKCSAFIRCAGRSPKDGEPLNRHEVWSIYQQHLRELMNNQHDKVQSSSSATPVQKLVAMSRTPLLHVTCGADAMSLLLSSERIYADMLDWVRFGEPEQVVLRQWHPNLMLENEFRVFVYNGKITAISQYDHYAFFAPLAEKEFRDIIQAGIVKLWRQVHARLKAPSYIVDVGYIPPAHQASRDAGNNSAATDSCIVEEGSFVVVEFSPFLPCTGAALFSWREDSDVLHGNCYQGEVEFRVKLSTSEVHPQIEEILELNWEQRWTAAHPYFPIPAVAGVNDVAGDNDDLKPWFGAYFTSLSAPSTVDVGAPPCPLSMPSILRGVASLLPGWMVGKRSTGLPPLANSSSAVSGGAQHMLFVYGTLKRGFQWNTKYLSPRLGAQFLGRAVTAVAQVDGANLQQHRNVALKLHVGDSGVPYLLHLDAQSGSCGSDAATQRVEGEQWQGHAEGQIVGELWAVTDECLRNLDDYEGVGVKQYYERVQLPVQILENPDTAKVCVDATSTSSVGENTPLVAEKTILANVYVLNWSEKITHVPSDLKHLVEAVAQGEEQGSLDAKSTEYVLSTNALQEAVCISEYTLAMHQQLYSPIQHIQVKQMAYIGNPSTWGKC